MMAPSTLDIRKDLVPPELLVYFEDPAVRSGTGYRNPWGVEINPGLARVWKWTTQRNPWRERKRAGVVASRQMADPLGGWRAADPAGRVCWLGHASALVCIDGVKVLIDPVFGRAGLARRHAPAPMFPDALPGVDVVAITHGHYDHLDRASLRALGLRFGEEVVFVTPAGLSASLPRACRRLIELSWWEALTVRGVDVTLVPAQHWHRRGPADANRCLWGGYVVRGSTTVYHSGDTGAFDGFRAIGHVFPDIDLALLPIGAWAPRWFMADQHMDPDGSVRAFGQLGARRFCAMHWNTFDLTDEPLDEGPAELKRAVERAGVPFDQRFVVPAHGETLELR